MVRFRWDLDDADFHRIMSLCVLVIVGLAAYIFSTNEEGGGIAGMLRGAAGLRNAGVSSTVATTSVMRWLPLIFFPLVIAQAYNLRPSVPLTAVSLVLRLRRRRGEKSLAGHYLDVSYSYFIVCLFSAGIHPNQGTYLTTYSYFFGQVGLILWALWTLRSGRFGLKVWAGGLAAILLLGFVGQAGINRLELMVQNFNAQWLARLWHAKTDPMQSMTAIGQIGELKLSPRIVIRLQPGRTGVAPNYLREASYRTYQVRSQTWQAGSAGSEFNSVQPETDGTTWKLLPAKKGSDTVSIACYLEGRTPAPENDPEGVLPLPSGTCQLEKLPNLVSVIALQTNKTGVVLATGLGLMMFDARYGPGATLDAPPDTTTNQFDLRVPVEETNALAQVIAGLNLAHSSDLEKRLAIQTFFAQHFTYSTWQGSFKRSTNSPLTRFLLKTRSGHCEYFATATVLLLRKLGVPARYAVGYSVHEAAGTGYVVRERDAHAWCLAWNSQTGTWDDFDTTPASWMAAEKGNAWLPDYFSDAGSWLVFQFEKFRYRQTDFRRYIVWTMTPVIAVLVYFILFQRRSRARAAGKRAAAERPVQWPGHDSAFYRLESSLAARGLPRQPQEPLSEWLERALAEPGLARLRLPLRELLRLHYRYRFDPPGLNDAEKKMLVENADSILGELAQVKAEP